MDLDALLEKNYHHLVDEECAEGVLNYLDEHPTPDLERLIFTKRLTKVAHHLHRQDAGRVEPYLLQLTGYCHRTAMEMERLEQHRFELCTTSHLTGKEERYSLSAMSTHLFGHTGYFGTHAAQAENHLTAEAVACHSYLKAARRSEKHDLKYAATMAMNAGRSGQKAYFSQEWNPRLGEQHEWGAYSLEGYELTYNVGSDLEEFPSHLVFNAARLAGTMSNHLYKETGTIAYLERNLRANEVASSLAPSEDERRMLSQFARRAKSTITNTYSKQPFRALLAAAR